MPCAFCVKRMITLRSHLQNVRWLAISSALQICQVARTTVLRAQLKGTRKISVKKLWKQLRETFTSKDLIKVIKTVGVATQIAHKLLELLKRGGFCLTKWISSSREVLATIPVKEQNKAKSGSGS